MRKFTKEITAFLATAAVGTSMGAAKPSSEEAPVRTAGVAMQTDYENEPTTTTIPGYGFDKNEETGYIGTVVETTSTTTQVYTEPPLMGTMVASSSTTVPPLAGVIMELPDTNTLIPETIPPLAGTSVATTTTTAEIPPLAGDVALPDCDINGDGDFNISDVVVFQKYLLNAPGVKLVNWYEADRCADGELNVFDLIMLKRDLINQGRYDTEPVPLDNNK